MPHSSRGDPIERVAALRELSEWNDPTDIRTVLSTLDSEYVPVQLEAVETLRSFAKSLKPAVWRAAERAREDETMTRALSASVWRQAAALREADGRPSDAMAAWHEVVNLDPNNLAARARLFTLAHAGGDRLAMATTARDLAGSVILFADGRWQPPAPNEQPDTSAGKGRVFGVPGAATVLRQICAAIDLGTDATRTLGMLSAGAGPQEQELLNIARGDAERALARIQGKRSELEEVLRADEPGFLPCGTDLASAPIAASRAKRIEAIGAIGRSGDTRLLPFVEGLGFSPSSDIKTAVTNAT